MCIPVAGALGTIISPAASIIKGAMGSKKKSVTNNYYGSSGPSAPQGTTTQGTTGPSPTGAY